jgi:pyrimidine-specific ribonucleoside hydrolase
MAKGAAKDEKSSLLTFKDGLPLDRPLFIQEIQELIDGGIFEKYGREEFERIILTHETHGHIGVYTLIGAKMGIFARELLGAPRNAMNVLSEGGGGDFPVRCLNDGLMVSTGCSPIFGKLQVNESKSNCAAQFSYDSRVLRLELKKNHQQQLEDKIAALVEKYKRDGVLTEPYWEGVTNLTWWAWQEWDRKSMFDVEWITE